MRFLLLSQQGRTKESCRMAVINRDFMDLRTRAELLDLCGDKAGAEKVRQLSLEVAREVDLICYAYQLLWRNRLSEAVEILELNVSRNRDSWNAWDSLAEAFLQQGDVGRAAECYGCASRLAPEGEERLRIERVLRELIALGAIAS